MTSTIIDHKISARMTYRRRVRRRRLKSMLSVLSEEANWRTKAEVIHNKIAVSVHIGTWRSVLRVLA